MHVSCSRLVPVLAVVAVLVSPGVASACDCCFFGEMPLNFAVDRARVVFHGEAMSAEVTGDTLTTSFRVLAVWKGTVAEEYLVTTSVPDGGNCGLEYRVGDRYIVFAGGRDGLRDNECSATRRYTDSIATLLGEPCAREDELADRLGEECLGPDRPAFVRGDANDDAEIDISDGVAVLEYLFTSVEPDPTCLKALDTNDSGAIDISDAISLLNFLFLGGGPPEQPYGEVFLESEGAVVLACGYDPTDDELTCDMYSSCVDGC